MSIKVIIVGGVAGGASAAARLRRLNEKADITVYERTGFMSYANCGLPYYLGDVITDESSLTLQTPEKFYSRFRVRVKVAHEVMRIDRHAKTVTVKDLATNEVFTDTYDKLILSPGAHAVIPNIEGIDSEKIFTLRTVEDTLAIDHYIDQTKAKRALVIGAGFIGLEMAENLTHRGLDVTLVQRSSSVLPTLDADIAAALHATLRAHNVTLKLHSQIRRFETDTDIIRAYSDREVFEADMVILAVGVEPETTLARQAGLTLGQKGAIVVNEELQTSDESIWAVGDAVEVHHRVSNQKTLISLAGPANKMGRMAADNIMGAHRRYNGSLGSSVLKLFDLTAATTGLNEKSAQAAGIDYEKIVLCPANHAGYYPGGRAMTMKVLFNRQTTELIGAQIVGFEGVDKRIDVLATALCAKMKALDLAELDLAYAPPYSSAKDPVNMAGFMADNIFTGLVKQFHWHDIEALQDKNVQLLDTRSAKEYERGHAPGFINVPLDELRDRLSELDPTRPVYVMCHTGIRSYIASRILIGHGFDVSNFSGGHSFYALVTKEAALAREVFDCGLKKSEC
ncbi:MAG: CoA-disulfide reductase [Burkholderiaceae bacterium]|nr:CoA-disulfide reductase [Burkholderiaceae bacterium]